MLGIFWDNGKYNGYYQLGSGLGLECIACIPTVQNPFAACLRPDYYQGFFISSVGQHLIMDL